MDEIMESVARAQRIVIKIGTSSLTYETGRMNLRRIDRLAMVLSDLMNQGKEIILVSSGAIGIGVNKMGLEEKPKDTRGKQAAAAVGQCELMYLYDKAFSGYSHTVAQILITRDGIAIPRRKRNMQNTFSYLIDKGIIPVVNENDTISVEEIEIGDNDSLSARVAELVDADLLILLSDIDGLYDHDPHRYKEAKIIDRVYSVDDVRHLAGGAVSKVGTGGMVTKLDAAEIATKAGINMVIMNGNDIDSIPSLLEGESVGTLFAANNYVEL